MVMRINPNQEPLWRTPFELQLGTGKNSVILKNLSNAQERMIAALYKGIADQQLSLITEQLGLTKDESKNLVKSVSEVMLTEPPALPINSAKSAKLKLGDDFVSGAFSEIIRASLLHSVDGEAVLLGRAERSVNVDDLSRAGLQICLGLAAAGIGHIISHDEGKVDKANLGPTGYPSQLIGQPRLDALRSILAASPNKANVSTGKKLAKNKLQKVDCAVLVSHQVIDPRRYASWNNRDIPHIAVTFDSERVWVSPMIVPGQTACLFCLEQMRSDKDASWPVIATQLLTSQKRFDDAASQLFSAGIVIQKILSRLDKVAGFEQSAENLSGFSLELSTGTVSEFTWPKHQACECVSKD